MRRFSFRPALDIRGRQFKGLRGFSGKPLHPPLTDVTIGAYFIGPLLGLLSFLFRNQEWSDDLFRAGETVLLLGVISSVATIVTGYADWFDTQAGTQIRRMANAHALTMLTATGIVLANVAYRYLGDAPDEPSTVLAALDVLILLLITLGGTIGGSMTYDWGFNVETSTDSPVWHPSDRDVIHPHQAEGAAEDAAASGGG
ncbi:MAG TPA: DUF2231 domain-containing protein [Actinomycetota bacterium]|nr:DUF2231 domain-containing protein [Actinomycetota bacterium]